MPNIQIGQNSQENRTNMDIILLILAKPLGKHGITHMHITYPPLWISECGESCVLQILPCQTALNEMLSSPKEAQFVDLPSSPRLLNVLNNSDTWGHLITPGGELINFHDGGDHVRPFSQIPKYVDQIFRRPQICWPIFRNPKKFCWPIF